MGSLDRFTDGRIPASPLRALFALESRWQRWLQIEAALALAEAEVGIVPPQAAAAIADAARVDRLDLDRVRAGVAATSHPLMPLISELSRVVGDPHGGWVHWGATTQNITQTGDALVLREAHRVLLGLIGELLLAMAALAERGAEMPAAGRTHGQHAVPITFGLKVAGWIDEFDRHVQRLHAVEPRVFTAMVGGAVGNFASLGASGPQVQARLAERIGLTPMQVPSRAISDGMAEYVCVLGLIAGSGARIAGEVYALMKTEVDELAEPASEVTIGSSTMPHKRNPQLADDCLAISAQMRALVPLALEGMLRDHEVDGAHSDMTESALRQSCIGAGDLLTRLVVILEGIELHPERMWSNLELTGGLIASEHVMLALGEILGRQDAHHIVDEVVRSTAASGGPFLDALASHPRVAAHLDRAALVRLLDPMESLGLSAQIAHDSARRAEKLAGELGDRGSVCGRSPARGV